MTAIDWTIRAARADDRQALASFSCANRAIPWEAEVEDFIQKQALDAWAGAPGAVDDDPRLLLALTRAGELFGVAAHEKAMLNIADGHSLTATHLVVVAVATTWQGRRFSTGERCSDVLMSAVMTDISQRVPPRYARVFATVHDENHRSLALLRRHGLVSEMTRVEGQPYRRPITAHRPPQDRHR